MKMEKILVSACLLGVPCRYDGASFPCKEVLSLSEKYILIPVCPEQAGGLPTPRPRSEITHGAVMNEKGADVTEEYKKGALYALELARKYGCTKAVLKEKSPSCGKGKIYDGSFGKKLVAGNGITAELLLENGIEVFGETDIRNGDFGG